MTGCVDPKAALPQRSTNFLCGLVSVVRKVIFHVNFTPSGQLLVFIDACPLMNGPSLTFHNVGTRYPRHDPRNATLLTGTVEKQSQTRMHDARRTETERLRLVFVTNLRIALQPIELQKSIVPGLTWMVAKSSSLSLRPGND
jgi:hypothetical protein